MARPGGYHARLAWRSFFNRPRRGLRPVRAQPGGGASSPRRAAGAAASGGRHRWSARRFAQRRRSANGFRRARRRAGQGAAQILEGQGWRVRLYRAGRGYGWLPRLRTHYLPGRSTSKRQGQRLPAAERDVEVRRAGSGATGEIMRERVRSRGRDVRVGAQIVGAGKARRGIATLAPASAGKMRERVAAEFSGVGILVQIPA